MFNSVKVMNDPTLRQVFPVCRFPHQVMLCDIRGVDRGSRVARSVDICISFLTGPLPTFPTGSFFPFLPSPKSVCPLSPSLFAITRATTDRVRVYRLTTVHTRMHEFLDTFLHVYCQFSFLLCVSHITIISHHGLGFNCIKR